jgi:putative addiction module killer protein
MYDNIRETDTYKTWYAELKDIRAKARIDMRINRLSQGNAGNVKPIGRGCSEMRVDYGPGYRVYFKDTGKIIYVLLCGGDKSTQDKDIKKALEIADNLEEFL